MFLGTGQSQTGHLPSKTSADFLKCPFGSSCHHTGLLKLRLWQSFLWLAISAVVDILWQPFCCYVRIPDVSSDSKRMGNPCSRAYLSLSLLPEKLVRPRRASKFCNPSRSVFSKLTSGRTTSYTYEKGRHLSIPIQLLDPGPSYCCCITKAKKKNPQGVYLLSHQGMLYLDWRQQQSLQERELLLFCRFLCLLKLMVSRPVDECGRKKTKSQDFHVKHLRTKVSAFSSSLPSA